MKQIVTKKKFPGVKALTKEEVKLDLSILEKFCGKKYIKKVCKSKKKQYEPEDVILQNWLVPSIYTPFLECHYFLEVHFFLKGLVVKD
mmetsp:Transcript_25155/g.18942  ORF Transcript_25155/g.18942 Transcript_25155/m.18942 type:complete len:88 (-) Transcript_25155:312-575(-)